MDRNLKAFVERENIAHYLEQIKSEADPVKRKLLVQLLNEEKAKYVSGNAIVAIASGALPPVIDRTLREALDVRA